VGLLVAGGGESRAQTNHGGRLLYSGADGIYVLAVDGGSPQRVWQAPSTDLDEAPVWSPDGQQIAFQGRDGNAWLMNADGSAARALTDQARPPSGCQDEWCAVPGTRVDSLRWSPAGDAISYRLVEQMATGSIWTQEIGGGAPRRLIAAPDLCLFNEGWTPDGRPLGSRCATLQSPSNATDLLGSGDPQPLVTGSQIAYSPDGRHLAFSNQSLVDGTIRVTLFVAETDGSALRAVAVDGQDPRWSSAGLLAYQVGGPDGWTMHVADTVTGRDVRLGPGQVGAWSGDGTWLFYTVTDARGGVIWRVHPDGTAAAPLAAGHSPAWAPQ
jgi:dipeptidyl aminopeptidase/acylaminoacyl peptidase